MFYLQVAAPLIGSNKNHVEIETDLAKVIPSPQLTSDSSIDQVPSTDSHTATRVAVDNTSLPKSLDSIAGLLHIAQSPPKVLPLHILNVFVN